MLRKETMAVVLLGAGSSRRFGSRKQFYPIEGKPMYLHMVEKALCLPANARILVTQYQEMEAGIPRDTGFSCVYNSDPDQGIASSLILGLQACPHNTDSILFAVCDQPYLRKETLQNFVDAYQNSPKGIACLSYQQIPGNPVIFHRTYYEELKALTGDIGGKRILNRHLSDVLLYPVEQEEELRDIDTVPED